MKGYVVFKLLAASEGCHSEKVDNALVLDAHTNDASHMHACTERDEAALRGTL